MQVLQERKPVRSWAIADTASEQAIDRMRKLELYAELKSAGCTTALCVKTIGGSKATCCRWLDRHRRQGLIGLCSHAKAPRHKRRRNGPVAVIERIRHYRELLPSLGKERVEVLLLPWCNQRGLGCPGPPPSDG